MPSKIATKYLLNTPLAITESALEVILSVLERETDLEALEAKRGKPFENSYEMTFRNGVAIIPIEGPIVTKANMFTRISGGTSTDMLARDAMLAEEDPDVNAIVFRYNTPGGEAVATDEFASLIKSFSTPTYAHVTGECCSAGLWSAAQCDHVSLSPISVMGSLGVVKSFRMRKNDDDETETIEVVSSISPHKRMDPRKADDLSRIQVVVDDVAEIFVQAVAEGRNTSVEDVEENFGQGDILVGQACVDVGMADKVTTFEALMAQITGSREQTNEEDMNKDELKKTHPEVFDAIFQEGKLAAEAEGDPDALATLQAANDQLKADNKALKDDNKALKDENTAASAESEKRILKLEASETARIASDQEKSADAILAAKLNASDLPGKVHPKVKACIDHTKFVAEGAFDADAYSKAADEEIADWVSAMAPAPGTLEGFGNTGEEGGTEGDNTVVDATVDSLMSHLQ